MIFVCVCPACGIQVRTERPQGETACNCGAAYDIAPETPVEQPPAGE